MTARKTPPDPDESSGSDNTSMEEENRTRNTKAKRKDLPTKLWNKYSSHKDSRTKFPIQIEEIKDNQQCERQQRETKINYPMPKKLIRSSITRRYDRIVFSSPDRDFTKTKRSTNKPKKKEKRPNNET